MSSNTNLLEFFRFLAGLPRTISPWRPTNSGIKGEQKEKDGPVVFRVLRGDKTESTYNMPEDAGKLLAELCRNSFEVLNRVYRVKGDKICLPGGMAIDKKSFLEAITESEAFKSMKNKVHVYRTKTGNYRFEILTFFKDFGWSLHNPKAVKLCGSYELKDKTITIPGENIDYHALLEQTQENIFQQCADKPDELTFQYDMTGPPEIPNGWVAHYCERTLQVDRSGEWNILKYK